MYVVRGSEGGGDGQVTYGNPGTVSPAVKASLQQIGHGLAHLRHEIWFVGGAWWGFVRSPERKS